MSRNTHRWAPHEVMAPLTDPGGPFAVVEELVLGQPVSVFEHRPSNVRTVLADAAERHPDRDHIVFDEQTLSYADTVASVARVAALLAQHGVAKGSRVAFAAANHLPYPIAWWATLCTGGVVASLNGWWTASELAHGIELSGPTVLFADERRLERLREVEVGLDADLVVLDLALLEPLLGPARADDPPLPDVAIDEDDPAIILFTSGTTGRPKGATLVAPRARALADGRRAAGRHGRPGRRADGRRRPTPTARRQPSTCWPRRSSTCRERCRWCPPRSRAPGWCSRRVGQWDEVTHLRLTEQHHVAGVDGRAHAVLAPARASPVRRVRHARASSRSAAGGAPFPPELIAPHGREAAAGPGRAPATA